MGLFVSKSSQTIVPIVKQDVSDHTDRAIISTMEDLQLPTSIIVEPRQCFVSVVGASPTASNV